MSSPQRGYFETSASEFLLFSIELATRPLFSPLNLGSGTTESRRRRFETFKHTHGGEFETVCVPISLRERFISETAFYIVSVTRR